jgi:hypothetical protein
MLGPASQQHRSLALCGRHIVFDLNRRGKSGTNVDIVCTDQTSDVCMPTGDAPGDAASLRAVTTVVCQLDSPRYGTRVPEGAHVV